MSCEELSQLADDTKKRLNEIWDTIGLPLDERQSEVEQLIARVTAVYNERVDKEQDTMNAMRVEINGILDQITDIRKQLQMAGDYVEAQGSMRVQLARYKSDLAEHLVHKDKQVARITEALAELHALWARLGQEVKPPMDVVGADITEARLNAVKGAVSEAAQEVERRKTAVADLCREIAEQIEELKLEEEAMPGASDKEEAVGARITAAGVIGPDIATTLTRTELTPLDLLILGKKYEEIGVHTDTIKQLESRTDVLSSMRAERDGKLRDLAHQITQLWMRLNVTSEEQQTWIRLHKGLSVKSLRSCQLELLRLLQLKAQSLSTLIAHARARLVELWDEMQMGANDRATFAAFSAEDVSDEVLDALEQHIRGMEVRAASMAPLLVAVGKRAELKQEQAELLKSQQDPNRFRIAGRMILEEKIRKRLDKLLPKVEGELRQGIPAWEAQYGEFRVNGVRYLDTMEAEGAGEPAGVKRLGTSMSSASLAAAAASSASASSSSSASSGAAGSAAAVLSKSGLLADKSSARNAANVVASASSSSSSSSVAKKATVRSTKGGAIAGKAAVTSHKGGSKENAVDVQ